MIIHALLVLAASASWAAYPHDPPPPNYDGRVTIMLPSSKPPKNPVDLKALVERVASGALPQMARCVRSAHPVGGYWRDLIKPAYVQARISDKSLIVECAYERATAPGEQHTASHATEQLMVLHAATLAEMNLAVVTLNTMTDEGEISRTLLVNLPKARAEAEAKGDAGVLEAEVVIHQLKSWLNATALNQASKDRAREALEGTAQMLPQQ